MERDPDKLVKNTAGVWFEVTVYFFYFIILCNFILVRFALPDFVTIEIANSISALFLMLLS